MPPAIDTQGVREISRRPTLSRLLRVVGASIVVTVLAIAIAVGALFFLMRGAGVENAYLNRRIQSGIEAMLGPGYKLEIGKATVGFGAGGLLNLKAADVVVAQADDGEAVSHFGSVTVGVEPFSILFGKPKVGSVTIEDSSIDGGIFTLPAGGAAPENMAEAIELLGDRLATLDAALGDARFDSLSLRNVEITGLPVWRREPGAVTLADLAVTRSDAGIEIQANLNTGVSGVTVTGIYAGSSEPALDLDIGGINLREWTSDPQGNEGPFGSDSLVRATAHIPFGKPASDFPSASVEIGSGALRIGFNGRTQVHELTLNFRLVPEENRLELVPSVLVAGEFNAQLSGEMTPVDAAGTLNGDWRFELAADPAVRQPTIAGETSVPTVFHASGIYVADNRVINVEDVVFEAGADRMTGKAEIGVMGPTPSFKAKFQAESVDFAAVRQLWPFWIAPPVRNWVYQKATGGTVSNFAIDADIPPGKLGRLRQGAKMDPEEFKLSLDFDGARVDSFGDLPPIEGASGHFEMNGMMADVKLDGGTVSAADGATAEVTGGRFHVEDIAKRPNEGELQLSLSGKVPVLAGIADAAPLRAFQRMKLIPDAFTGGGDVDVVARFPFKRRIGPDDVDWHALVDVEKGASSEKVFGHQVKDANIQVEVTPKSARVTGNAVVDGTLTKLEMTEPLGKSGSAPVRNFSAVLDNDARKKMGLSLETIINGDIQVTVDQIDDNSQLQRLDLKNAELTLPWIGWSKGREIPANASYVMRKKGDVTYLDKFYIEGDGFNAAGTMAFDKSGLVSADFADISLNEGDSFALDLQRKNKTYNIKITGTRMDARVLINKLFHQGGFGDEQGSSNIVLSANLAQVHGFNGRTIHNVSMRYGTKDGWFDSLSLRGNFTDQAFVNILGTTEDRRTKFEIDSNDAGATLAFTDVYRRMSGGGLRASLIREVGGAFVGPVQATGFVVTDEPRLKSLVSEPAAVQTERGQNMAELKRRLSSVNTQRVRFLEARADIEKEEGLFRVRDGILNSTQFGFTFDGLLYDQDNNMDLVGTFLPAMAISRAIGFIPLVGSLLGDGRESGLFGITFRMRGPLRNPTLEVNPISMVTPGVFRKVFEYRN
jgi:hypothetical protein